MFGRMLAGNHAKTIEASVQVSHAFTSNKVTVESDFFTAVDDINSADNAGAGHLGETEFGSGVYYTHIVVDTEQLVKNIGSVKLANEAIKALTETAMKVSPSGKQNSFASHARAHYVLAEMGDEQPRQLSSAYIVPVGTKNMLDDSVKKLESERDNMDRAYGKCYDSNYVFDVNGKTGTLKELLNFVAR